MSQKTGIQKCNLAGKPVIITRVVDSMVDNLRPTRRIHTLKDHTAEVSTFII